MSIADAALDGSELSLVHAKQKLAMGSRLELAERLGATSATAAQQRDVYGPVPADAKPVEIPLPETVKGAIANARS
jgi:hypothetical protein